MSEANCHVFQYEKFVVRYSYTGKEPVLHGMTLK